MRIPVRMALHTSTGYGKDVSPTDILIRRTVSNPQADGLIQVIVKAVAAK